MTETKSDASFINNTASINIPHSRKILVVDDSSVNRRILFNILKNEFDVLEASEGQEALDILKAFGNCISLVLLDIIMPVMNGYELLAEMRSDLSLSKIPVIITTSNGGEDEELRSLQSGASDFVAKPYNPDIVRYRVESILRLREDSAMLDLLEYDRLTGVFNKEFFYRRIEQSLENSHGKKFDIICCDVENFKLVNEKHGSKIGDELLSCLAKVYLSFAGADGFCGRLGADVFAIFTERRQYDDDSFLQIVEKAAQNAPISNVAVKFGVYSINDESMPPSGMCDRAILSLQSIKKKYGKIFAVYDDTIRLDLLREQQILDSMESALAESQFDVYLQPKHEAQNGRISGAEALIRWHHPEFGYMTPGEFIPLFERSGFIVKADYYVWEKVCRILNSWLKEGKKIIPVSVNVSRADFGVDGIVQMIESLVDKYDIPHELFHLEVTESSYTDNPQQIVAVVEQLRADGFYIEMDDFGSGYSSLNMLSELPIDCLKLDMRFLKKHKNASNQKNILGFILSLSKWMGLPTVAEGVESRDEVELLRTMGCDYIQGFYYAKPMPLDGFEQYLEKNRIIESMNKKSDVEEGDNNLNVLRLERKNSVLVVEDAEADRTILRNMLSQYYDVVTVQNGEEAYEYLKLNSEVSAILLDLLMPGMDGFEFLRRLRNDLRKVHIPVIITSEVGIDSELRALKLGANDFVAKPYQKEILLHHIRSAIDGAELRAIKQQMLNKKTTLSGKNYRDAQTDLLNRQGLVEAVSQIPKDESFAVIMLDIDNLKQYNDTFGTDFGDAMVCSIAEALRLGVRNCDIIARVGGDEFLVIIRNISAPEYAVRKCRQICESVGEVSLLDGRCHASCSAGVTLATGNELFVKANKRVDQALYEAKRRGKGKCCLWEEREK